MRPALFALTLPLFFQTPVVCLSQAVSDPLPRSSGRLPAATEVLSPRDWAQTALARCLEERAAWEAERAPDSQGQDSRLERILPVSRAGSLEGPTENLRAAAGLPRPGAGNDLGRALDMVFADATPCGLEALEATLVFAFFDLPFTRDMAVKRLDIERVSRALEQAWQHRLAETGSPQGAFGALRPSDQEHAHRYVGELTRRLAAIASVHVAQIRERMGTAQQLLGQEELQLALLAALRSPEQSPIDACFPESERPLRRLVGRLDDFFRQAAEPARLQVYLHNRAELVEAALRTRLPDPAARALFREAERALYGDRRSIRLLSDAAPEDLLTSLEPVVDRWFRNRVLPAVRASLREDPFNATRFFIQTGAIAGDRLATKGSRVHVASSSFDFEELAELSCSQALRQIEESRVPASFIEEYVSLREGLDDLVVDSEEMLERLEASELGEAVKERWRGYATPGNAPKRYSAGNAFVWLTRSAGRIPDQVDWELVRATLGLVHAAKRERLTLEIARTRASDHDERLPGYLQTAAELMLELEWRLATESRYREAPGGGAVIDWVLRHSVNADGVEVQLWQPGGVTGKGFGQSLSGLSARDSDDGTLPKTGPRLLHDRRRYGAEMLKLVDSARDSLHVVSFDWEIDAAGKDMAYRLMAKKLGLDASGYQAFLKRFAAGLPQRAPGARAPEPIPDASGCQDILELFGAGPLQDGASAEPIAFEDIHSVHMKNLLFYHSFTTTEEPGVAAVRGRLEGLLDGALQCPAIDQCGDLSRLLRLAGDEYDPERGTEPGYRSVWEAYRQLQTLFEAERPRLRDTRPRGSLAEYVEDADRLREFVRRFGARRGDDPAQPFPVSVVGLRPPYDGPLCDPCQQLPLFLIEQVRDIFMPLAELDIRVLLWRGLLEEPWQVGPVPAPGRRTKGAVPMPFIPHPWLEKTPGAGWAGLPLRGPVAGEGSSVAGHVHDETGAPVPGAVVSLRAEDEEVRPRMLQLEPRCDPTRTTDGEGRFLLRGARPGRPRIGVTVEGLEHGRDQTLTVARPYVDDVRVDIEWGPVLAGRVTQAEGRPIAGARLVASVYDSGAWQDARLTTDAEGRFSVRGFEGESTRLSVSAAGYATLWLRDVPTGERDLHLVLARTGGFSGRVLLAGGEPASSVRVQAVATSNMATARRSAEWVGSERRLETDDGRYTCDGLTAGTWAATFHAPGQRPVSIEGIVVEPGRVTPDVDVRLEQGPAVVGVVSDLDSGAPVRGAVIQARSGEGWRHGRPSGSVPQTHSDADGRYRLEGLPSGKLALVVLRGAYPEKVVEDLELPPAGEDLRVDIELGHGGVIAGSVLRANGFPDADVLVSVSSRRGRVDQSAHTDPYGRYRLEGLPPGCYEVRKSPGGRIRGWIAKRSVEVVEGETAVVDFRAGAVRMAGRVLRGTHPVSGAYLYLWRESFDLAARNVHEATTDGEGRFVLEGIRPGRHGAEIRFIRADGEEGNFSAVVEVPDQRLFEWDLVFRYAVSGRVVAADTGEPVAGAGVQLRLHDEAPLGLMRRRTGGVTQGTRCGPDGRWRIELTQPGRFVAGAWATHYACSPLHAVESDGSDVAGVVLALERGDQLVGTVRDASGRPIERAYVSLQTEGSARPSTSSTNADGEFSRRAPSGSESRLVVLPPGHAPVFVNGVRASPEPLEIRTSPGGGLAVELGVPAERRDALDLELRDEAGTDLMPSLLYAASTELVEIDNSGSDSCRISFPRLPAGNYTVVVHSGGETRSAPVTLAGGTTTQLEFAF